MSTIGEPGAPGRLPKQVYWRRRAVVLLGLIAVIVIVVLIIVRPGAGAQGEVPVGAGSSATPTSAAGSTPAPGSLEGDAAAGDAAGDASATEPGGPCAADDISVVPVTDATNYAAGANPMISFSITNTGTVACTINAGTAQQVYTITSGPETYWLSTDCQTEPTDTEALLEPGVAVTSTPFSWDRTRSATDTCASPDRPQVPAAGASYHLAVSVAGIPSTTTQQFILN